MLSEGIAKQGDETHAMSKNSMPHSTDVACHAFSVTHFRAVVTPDFDPDFRVVVTPDFDLLESMPNVIAHVEFDHLLLPPRQVVVPLNVPAHLCDTLDVAGTGSVSTAARLQELRTQYPRPMQLHVRSPHLRGADVQQFQEFRFTESTHWIFMWASCHGRRESVNWEKAVIDYR